MATPNYWEEITPQNIEIKRKVLELKEWGINVRFDRHAQLPEWIAHLSIAKSQLIPEPEQVRIEPYEFWLSLESIPATPIDVIKQWLNKTFPLLNAPLFVARYRNLSRHVVVPREIKETIKTVYVKGDGYRHEILESNPQPFIKAYDPNGMRRGLNNGQDGWL